jgi:glycosyltransferase involved in cell wall biosynthesis
LGHRPSSVEGVEGPMICPAVSMIIPTYNRAAFLPRMLDSVLAQTHSDYELILIDNGSTDFQTNALCRAYVNADSRIRFFHIEVNEGPASARNLGIEAAQGKYLIHLDDDDYCRPDHVEKLYSLITKYDADVALSGSAHDYAGHVIPNHVFSEIYEWNRAEVVAEFLKREKFNAGAQTKLYKRKIFDHVRYIPGKIIDDIHVTYRLLSQTNKAVAHGEPTYHFCKHSGNTTSFLEKNSIWPELLDEYLIMQQERIHYISQWVPEEKEHVHYSAWSYMISMIEKIEQGNGPGCESQFHWMKKELQDHSFQFLSSPWVTPREIDLMNRYVL